MEELSPVRKLHTILKQAVEHGDSNGVTIYALQKSEQFVSLGEDVEQAIAFTELLRNSEKSLQRLKSVKNLDTYLKLIRDVQALFLKNGLFQATWNDLKSPLIHHNLMSLLDVCADILDKEQEPLFLKNSELQAFLEQFENLLQDINASDLDESTKAFIRLRIEEICEGIRQSSFSEPDKLRNTIKMAIGEIVIGSITIAPEQKEKQPFKDFLDGVGKLAAALALSRNTQEWLIPHAVDGIHHVQHLLSSVHH